MKALARAWALAGFAGIGTALAAPAAAAAEPSGAPAREGGSAPAAASESLFGADPAFFRHRPTPMSLEAGIYFGLAWFSVDHNLQDLSKVGPRNPHQAINDAPSVGVRVGFFPLSFLGAEAEGGLIPSHTSDTESATIWTLRGHVVAQLPLAHIVPFVYGGGGMMALVSDPLGNDTDPVTYFGGGLKLAISRYLSFRIDARDNLMQKNRLLPGTSNGDLVHNGELLGSALFTLGRTPWPEHEERIVLPPPPDSDNDGVPDDVDKCPKEPGGAPFGCPPPKDTDGDGIPDDADKCPKEPEDGKPPDPTDGCPSTEPSAPPPEAPKEPAPPS